jgi:hypothetical protein
MMGGDQLIHGRPIASVPSHPGRHLSVVVLVLLTSAALMVVSRRIAGALTHPLEPASLLTAGVLVAATAMTIRLGWFLPPAIRASRALDRAMMLLTSLAVLALGTGLCVYGTKTIGASAICAVLAAEEAWAWAWYTRRGREKRGQNCFSFPRPVVAAVGKENSSDPFSPGEEVTQQLTRCQAADGAEELSGWLRMAFAAGQRTGSLHVAFCPPFVTTPELAIEQCEGPEVRIKTAQLLPYGVRLDLKLASAADEVMSVLLQFSARTHGE